MSKDNWIKVVSTSQIFQAEMIKGMLIENEIEAVILNQIDSSYQSFGASKVMVRAEDEQKARALINEIQKEIQDED